MSIKKDLHDDNRYSTLIKNYQSGNIAIAQANVKILLEDYPHSSELLEIKENLNIKANHYRDSKNKKTKITVNQIIVYASTQEVSCISGNRGNTNSRERFFRLAHFFILQTAYVVQFYPR